MKEEEIIQKLSERLRDAEAPVDPAVWEGISQSLPVAGAGASGAAGSLSTTSWIAIAVVSAGLIGGTLWLTSEDTPPAQEKTPEQIQVNTPEPATSEQLTESENTEDVPVSDAAKAADDGASEKADASPSTGNADPAPQREVVQQIASDPAADTILWESVEESRPSEPVTAPAEPQQTDASSAFAEQKESSTPESSETTEFTLPAFSVTPDLNDPMSFTFALATDGVEEESELKSVEWILSDGGSAEGTLADYTFYDEGTYTVTLRATDSKGNVHTQQREVEAYLPARLELPNVFTPNGDGVNDRLTIGERSRKIEIEYLAVYDSNGTLYYEQNGTGPGWNGMDVSGNEAPEGNYILVVKALSERGQLFNERRVVRLER